MDCLWDTYHVLSTNSTGQHIHVLTTLVSCLHIMLASWWNRSFCFSRKVTKIFRKKIYIWICIQYTHSKSQFLKFILTQKLNHSPFSKALTNYLNKSNLRISGLCGIGCVAELTFRGVFVMKLRPFWFTLSPYFEHCLSFYYLWMWNIRIEQVPNIDRKLWKLKNIFGNKYEQNLVCKIRMISKYIIFF